MNDEPYKNDREILEALCEAIFPAGSYVPDLPPEQTPGIACKFEGYTGVAMPLFFIKISDPVIKELAKRAIKNKIGGLMTSYPGFRIEKDERGEIDVSYTEGQPEQKKPIFVHTISLYNALKDEFKKLNYSDNDIIGGLWNYLNGDAGFLLQFFKEFYRRRESGKEAPQKPDDMLDKIVHFDSTTSADSSKWFGARGVYHDIRKIRWIDDIIESEEKTLGRKLNEAEKVAVLEREKEYLAPDPNGGDGVLVISDRWGEFLISTTLPVFNLSYIEEKRKNLQDRLANPELFDDPETIEKINAELSKIILYQTAAKFYRLSVAAYYDQKTEQLIIPKSEALKFFGRDSNDKAAYAEIKSAGWAIYNASIIIKGDRFNGAQRFWSSFHEDYKYFYIGFLPEILPATRELVESYGKERTPETREILRQRRYYEYPPRIDAAGLSAYGDFYVQFLLRENGNHKIKNVPDGQKVIAYSGGRHCTEANIQDSNNNRKLKAMISTWRDIMNKTNVIIKIEPGLKTVAGMKPKQFLKSIIHVYAISEAEKINEYLRERQQKK